MQLRTAHDLRHVIHDARRRLGWSQSRLAEAVGVSRQWVSLVETGKTSVEFDLVLSSLQALGYMVHVEPIAQDHPYSEVARTPIQVLSHEASGRTSLTRRGNPLGHQRSRRKQSDRDYQGDA